MTHIKYIPMDEAKRELAANNGIILLDARDEDEYASSHIDGAVNIPLHCIGDAKIKIPDVNAKIFVYCLHGRRSTLASYELMQMGFADVTNIGGMEGGTECEIDESEDADY